MAEILYLTDLQNDRRDEILFGGSTVTIGYHLLGAVRGGRIHQVARKSGGAFILVSGYDFDEARDPPEELERAFGCEDVDDDGIDEFVQVRVRRNAAKTLWSTTGYDIRGTTAVRVFADSGAVTRDRKGIAWELVAPCELRSR